MKRIGMVIEALPERLDYYKSIHADGNEGVRHILKRYHIRNFSIYTAAMDNGKQYLFGYYEYVGDEYEKDMAEMRALPEYALWLEETDSCQKPLVGEVTWKVMDRVFFLE
jgi:L-rhamnose mutarotase